MNNSKVLLTIAVITCRRPNWLKRLLVSLSEQVVSENVSIEILVVDNACEEICQDVVNKQSLKSPHPIIYKTEPTPGIVAARNQCVTTFLKSDSQHLLFIDDDEWPENNNWAQQLLDMQRVYNADIMTSHVISVGEGGTPPWAIKLIYGKNNLNEGDKVDVFYTNNLLICRHVLENIKPCFDARFAMTGASDYHFSLKCNKAGYKAYYTVAPVIEEFPSSRASIKWFIRRGFRSGIGFTRSHLFENKLPYAIVFCLLMSSIRLLRGFGYLLLGAVTFNKMTFVDGLFRLASSIGTLVGFFGVKHEEYKTIHGN